MPAVGTLSSTKPSLSTSSNLADSHNDGRSNRVSEAVDVHRQATRPDSAKSSPRSTRNSSKRASVAGNVRLRSGPSTSLHNDAANDADSGPFSAANAAENAPAFPIHRRYHRSQSLTGSAASPSAITKERRQRLVSRAPKQKSLSLQKRIETFQQLSQPSPNLTPSPSGPSKTIHKWKRPDGSRPLRQQDSIGRDTSAHSQKSRSKSLLWHYGSSHNTHPVVDDARPSSCSPPPSPKRHSVTTATLETSVPTPKAIRKKLEKSSSDGALDMLTMSITSKRRPPRQRRKHVSKQRADVGQSNAKGESAASANPGLATTETSVIVASPFSLKARPSSDPASATPNKKSPAHASTVSPPRRANSDTSPIRPSSQYRNRPVFGRKGTKKPKSLSLPWSSHHGSTHSAPLKDTSATSPSTSLSVAQPVQKTKTISISKPSGPRSSSAAGSRAKSSRSSSEGTMKPIMIKRQLKTIGSTSNTSPSRVRPRTTSGRQRSKALSAPISPTPQPAVDIAADTKKKESRDNSDAAKLPGAGLSEWRSPIADAKSPVASRRGTQVRPPTIHVLQSPEKVKNMLQSPGSQKEFQSDAIVADFARQNGSSSSILSHSLGSSVSPSATSVGGDDDSSNSSDTVSSDESTDASSSSSTTTESSASTFACRSVASEPSSSESSMSLPLAHDEKDTFQSFNKAPSPVQVMSASTNDIQPQSNVKKVREFWRRSSMGGSASVLPVLASAHPAKRHSVPGAPSARPSPIAPIPQRKSPVRSRSADNVDLVGRTTIKVKSKASIESEHSSRHYRISRRRLHKAADAAATIARYTGHSQGSGSQSSIDPSAHRRSRRSKEKDFSSWMTHRNNDYYARTGAVPARDAEIIQQMRKESKVISMIQHFSLSGSGPNQDIAQQIRKLSCEGSQFEQVDMEMTGTMALSSSSVHSFVSVGTNADESMADTAGAMNEGYGAERLRIRRNVRERRRKTKSATFDPEHAVLPSTAIQRHTMSSPTRYASARDLQSSSAEKTPRVRDEDQAQIKIRSEILQPKSPIQDSQPICCPPRLSSPEPSTVNEHGFVASDEQMVDDTSIHLGGEDDSMGEIAAPRGPHSGAILRHEESLRSLQNSIRSMRLMTPDASYSNHLTSNSSMSSIHEHLTIPHDDSDTDRPDSVVRQQHLQVIQDLQDLMKKTKDEKETEKQRLMKERMLRDLLETSKGNRDSNLALTVDEVSDILAHITLCQQTNTPIRWDLINDIVFPDGVDEKTRVVSAEEASNTTSNKQVNLADSDVAEGIGTPGVGSQRVTVAASNASTVAGVDDSHEQVGAGELHSDDAIDNFRKQYKLNDDEMAEVIAHLNLCEETNTEVRWDIIHRIIYPEHTMDDLGVSDCQVISEEDQKTSSDTAAREDDDDEGSWFSIYAEFSECASSLTFLFNDDDGMKNERMLASQMEDDDASHDRDISRDGTDGHGSIAMDGSMLDGRRVLIENLPGR